MRTNNAASNREIAPRSEAPILTDSITQINRRKKIWTSDWSELGFNYVQTKRTVSSKDDNG